MKRMRNLIIIILTAVLLLSVSGTSAGAAGVTATPTSSTVLVNNQTVTFQAYTIGGNNYFRLRDLAMAFVGSTERFSVQWDGDANAVRLLSNSLYSPIGGELSVSSSPAPVTAVPTTSQIYLDGKLIYAKAYVIGESNYFKLRDIGAAMTFGVTYDDAAKAIKIDTTKEYYLPALLEILPDATYKEYYTPEQMASLPSGTVAEGFIFYNRTESGSITITEHGRSYFSIASINLTSDNDLAKLKNIIGIFVSAPDQVMAAAASSKTDGQKTLQIEGKSIISGYAGETLTITISW